MRKVEIRNQRSESVTADGPADERGCSVSGDQTYYVASVLDGRGDLEFSIVGGVARPLVAAPGRSLEFLSYAVGLVPTLNEGFGWNGSGAVSTPYSHLVAQDWFETYALGVISGGAITDGTGWNGSGGFPTPYVQQVAGETRPVPRIQ